MFHNISTAVAQRMQYLENQDAQDCQDGTPHPQRLRQIPPETGKFLALLAANTPAGAWLEVGTSAGYSALWLSLAATRNGRILTTFELLLEKIVLAQETFRQAGITHLLEQVAGVARHFLHQYAQIAFCFLDAEKELYADVYELVADNATSHAAALQPFIDQALADPRVDALVVPIGKGH